MRSSKPEIRIAADAEELTRAAAEEFVSGAEEAVRAKGFFAVVLSGGSTPKGLFALLATDSSFRARMPWDRIHFFWGDERHVPPDHPESNYRMAYEVMLSKVPVPSENVHRIIAENPDAEEAADDYERRLREFFKLQGKQLPRFDLVLLGLGPDGHTASIFPGSDAAHDQGRIVVANWVAKLNAYRITLTLPALNNATCVLFLASGEEKAEILRAVLQDKSRAERLPAQLIRPTNGRLLWLVDRAAARLVEL
jgi:6-phosphogluconolactonase